MGIKRFRNLIATRKFGMLLCSESSVSCKLLRVRLQLRFNPIMYPVRVPPFHRIDGYPIQQHGEMQMVSPREARLTTATDLLLAFHLVTFFDLNGAQVAVKTLKPATVVDDHRVTIDPEETRKHHGAVICCAHGHVL